MDFGQLVVKHILERLQVYVEMLPTKYKKRQ